jgi:hypothetical protein
VNGGRLEDLTEAIVSALTHSPAGSSACSIQRGLASGK